MKRPPTCRPTREALRRARLHRVLLRRAFLRLALLRPLSLGLLVVQLACGSASASAAARPGAPPGPLLEPPALFALVVGYNQPLSRAQAPLRFADDDAVQTAGLLADLGATVVLLTTLDEASRDLYPDLSPQAPTPAALGRAMTSLNARMAQARSQHLTPHFYFVYSGHGDIVHAEGVVSLDGGRLTRRALLSLLEGSEATTNHVIIDACKSYFMVFERGPGGTRAPAEGRFLFDDLELPGDTGVLLSTTSAAESHEWEVFQGGIFSHELRSALRGAADLNRDGAVTYREASAFIWNANASIPSPRYRPDVFSQAPSDASDGDAILIPLRQAVGDRLVVGPGHNRHTFVEDARGLRLVDLHPGPDQEVVVLVPRSRPLFVRIADADDEWSLPGGAEIHLAQLSPSPLSVLPRGAAHEAFRALFNAPFDVAAVTAYERSLIGPDLARAQHADLNGVRRDIGLSSPAFAALGGVFTWSAMRARDTVDAQTSGLDRAAINTQISRRNGAAVSCYVAGGAALATYLVWTLWPERPVQIEVLPGPEPGLGVNILF